MPCRCPPPAAWRSISVPGWGCIPWRSRSAASRSLPSTSCQVLLDELRSRSRIRGRDCRSTWRSFLEFGRFAGEQKCRSWCAWATRLRTYPTLVGGGFTADRGRGCAAARRRVRSNLSGLRQLRLERRSAVHPGARRHETRILTCFLEYQTASGHRSRSVARKRGRAVAPDRQQLS